MALSRKTIIIALVGIWIIFSAVYIARDIWEDFQTEQVSRAYQLGKTDMINVAILQAKNEKCEPFLLWSDNEQIQLININCLQQAEPSAPSSEK
jgi:hypothetical protein